MVTPKRRRLGPGKIPRVNFLDEKGYRIGIPGKASKSSTTWTSDPEKNARNRNRPIGGTGSPVSKRRAVIVVSDNAVMSVPAKLWVNPPWVKMKNRGYLSESGRNRTSMSGNIAPTMTGRRKLSGRPTEKRR